MGSATDAEKAVIDRVGNQSIQNEKGGARAWATLTRRVMMQ